MKPEEFDRKMEEFRDNSKLLYDEYGIETFMHFKLPESEGGQPIFLGTAKSSTLRGVKKHISKRLKKK